VDVISRASADRSAGSIDLYRDPDTDSQYTVHRGKSLPRDPSIRRQEADKLDQVSTFFEAPTTVMQYSTLPAATEVIYSTVESAYTSTVLSVQPGRTIDETLISSEEGRHINNNVEQRPNRHVLRFSRRPCHRTTGNHIHPNSAWRDLHKLHHSLRNLVLNPCRSRITASYGHTYANSDAVRFHFREFLHSSWLQSLQRLHIHSHSSRTNIHNHSSRRLSYGNAVRNNHPSRRNPHRSRR
jgi:hypothetical protein